jgi:hypothetical protein
MVSRVISQQINKVTHWLCGWTIKEIVSRAISQQVDDITHKLCGVM